MDTLVRGGIALLNEPSVARLLPGVDPLVLMLVLLQLAGGKKVESSIRADVLLGGRSASVQCNAVQSRMFRAIALPGEPHVAERALERPLPSVHPQVLLQIAGGWAPLAAERADVGFGALSAGVAPLFRLLLTGCAPPAVSFGSVDGGYDALIGRPRFKVPRKIFKHVPVVLAILICAGVRATAGKRE